MTEAYLYAAARTPFGRFGGALAGVRPDDLAAVAVSGVLSKAPMFDPAEVGDVVFGNANGAGEENRNVGRMAVLLAGLPTSVPATTVNRLCGSSLDAAMMASRTVESGDADLVLAGGVESMTRAPWVLPKPSRAFPAGDAAGEPTDAGRVDGVAGRVQRTAGGPVRDFPAAPGRIRGPFACSGRHGVECGVVRRPRGRCPGRGPSPGRGNSAVVDSRDAIWAHTVLPSGRVDHRR